MGAKRLSLSLEERAGVRTVVPNQFVFYVRPHPDLLPRGEGTAGARPSPIGWERVNPAMREDVIENLWFCKLASRRQRSADERLANPVA
jgi:hypothetical protein